MIEVKVEDIVFKAEKSKYRSLKNTGSCNKKLMIVGRCWSEQ